MKLKRILCGLTAAVMALQLSISSLAAVGERAAVLPNTVVHTQDEIKKYVKNHPFDSNAAATYDIEPSASSNTIGKLSDKTLNDALNAMNVMRYIAGVGEVVLDKNYNELAQAASYISSINGNLNYPPAKPDNVSDEIYQLGLTGINNSYRGSGHANPTAFVLSNSSRCINPEISKTGIGYVNKYSCIYGANSNSNTSKNVCWPAQNMPTEYFDKWSYWNVSIGTQLNADNIKVTLTRKSDSKTWVFSNQNADGYFYVSNFDSSITFRPDNINSYNNGDSFNVKIEGLDSPLSYNVNFFALDNSSESAIETYSTASGGTAEMSAGGKKAAVIVYGNINCGRTRSLLKEITESNWDGKDVKIFYADAKNNTKAEVLEFSKAYKNIVCCYDTGGAISKDMWKYVHSTGWSGSILFPVVVIKDSKDAVKHVMVYDSYQPTAQDVYNEISKFTTISNTPSFTLTPNVAKHTQSEIKKYVESHPFDSTAKPSYITEPSYSSNTIGTLGSKTLNDALNALNVMRYIAGLGEVTLDKEYNELAQAASYVNNANKELSHYPVKPANVTNEIYQLGSTGASKSNLGMGYSNPASSIIYGYMNDSDSSNIDRVGHRRWCLCPSMGKAGFGYVGNCTAMYAHDKSNTAASETYVCWPAQNMPTEYFGGTQAWSISTGKTIKASEIKVTLTRKSDSKKWIFSAQSSDGYFNVENSNYGLTGCIIFRPNNIGGYNNGDSFNVKVESTGAPLSYDVTFFNLYDKPVSSSTTTSSTRPSSSSSSATANRPSSSSASSSTPVSTSATSSTKPEEPVFSSTATSSTDPEEPISTTVTDNPPSSTGDTPNNPGETSVSSTSATSGNIGEMSSSTASSSDNSDKTNDSKGGAVPVIITVSAIVIVLGAVAAVIIGRRKK